MVAVFCFCISGCTTTNNFVQGRDFNAERREQIVKGQSTKADILSLYGDPTDKGIDNKENEYWIYLYVESHNEFNIWTNSSRGNKRTKKLIIIFDHKDIVQNFIYSNSDNPSSFKFNGY